MAKPVNNLPEWADGSNAGNYVGGPYAGMPRKVSIPGAVAAEGFRPGADDPSAAEHVNDYLNLVSLFIRWVFDGTSAGDATAHIVETDATGTISAQQGVFATTTGVANTWSLQAECPEDGGNALRLHSDMSNASPLISAEHDDLGAFVEFVGGAFAHATCGNDGIVAIDLTTDGTNSDGINIETTGDGSDGIRVNVEGAFAIGVHAQVIDANSVAVQGLGVDAGIGGRFFGGAVGGQAIIAESFAAAAVDAEGGVPGSGAVVGLGKTTAYGGHFTGGPTGAHGVVGVGVGASNAGVYGEATNASSGKGVIGTTAAASGTSAAGVHGLAPGSGTGVLGEGQNGAGVLGRSSGTGAGVVAETTGNGYAATFTAGGTRAEMLVTPRVSDPSVVANGALWHLSGRGFSTFMSSVARLFWHTAGGVAIGWDSDFTPGTRNNSPLELLTVALTGANAPVATGTVFILAAIEVGRNAGTPDFQIEIEDDTAGVPVHQETVTLYQPASGYERFVVYLIPYPLPASGNRTFKMVINSSDADAIRYRSAAMMVLGVF